MCYVCNSEFAEYPSNLSLPVGSLAVFRCSHLMADEISWRVNNTPFNRLQSSDIRQNSTMNREGAVVYMLIIPATAEHNGTEVKCVAIFDSSLPLRTPPVTLTVIPGWLDVSSSKLVFEHE